MRRSTLRAAISFLGAGALVAACTSNSNSPPADDGSVADLDAGTFDSATPADDAGPLPDAGHDATLQDAESPGDSAANDDASDSAVADAPVDSAIADAADSAIVDAGPGAVTSPPGLQLTIFRQGHTATLLNDGRVLFCGGYYTETSALASCDLFDPTTTTIAAGPAMHYGRQYQSATLLADGQVLIAGGTGPTQTDGGAYGIQQTAEVLDPTATTFTLVSNLMQSSRTGQPAVLLPSGPNANQVLLIGGSSYDTATSTYVALSTSEVFNPGDASASGTITLITPQTHFQRPSSTAAALRLADGGNGGVLVAGGVGPVDGGYNGETVDPALSAFTFTAGVMSSYHQVPYSTTLADGRIFIAGGTGTADGSTADIYDPATRTFTSVTLPSPRWYSPVTTLKSGRVLFAGGQSPSGALGDVLIYDPTSNQFSEATGALSVPRSIPTVTTLQDGRVVIAGGQSGTGMVVPTVDIFTE